MARPGQVATAILLTLERFFKLDSVTRMASVELWVLLTTLLLVVRFVIDFKGPWFGNPGSIRTFVVLTLEILNQNMVIYTMGLMQLSGARKVNDYFQVWAVLLVTLQYSVKIGRPYTRSKQAPLLDLMSSFWSANLLRVQTLYLLSIPLWTIWFLNAVRIIVLFISSGKGETKNQQSMRLVSDYMSYEDTLSPGTACLYLVCGEHRVLENEQVQDQESYKIKLDPQGVHREQLVTLETISKWKKSSGLLGAGEAAARRRDLCLSFALYKLLRRRFFDLPMHEMDRPAGKEKMRSVVLGILSDRERAFRITGAELCFLRDFFYSKHATVFAGGLWVPLLSLLLSLCLATATGYIAYPARYIPDRMDPADRNRITHGVFITRLMVAIIVLKELLEIVLYLCSRWAKVLMLCKYAQRQPGGCGEATMRWFVLCFGRAFSACISMLCCFCSCFCFCFCFCSCCKANKQTTMTTVRQQNLLVTVRELRLGLLPPFTTRMVILRGVYGKAGLEDYIKDAIFNRLKRLETKQESKEEAAGTTGMIAIDNYFSNAFGSKSKSKAVVEWPSKLNKEVDTHIILVWHIATSLCEISFFNEVKALGAVGQRPRGPFMVVEEPNGSSSAPPAGSESAAWSQHKQYATAVTLSNYCVYLVSKALVPDNRIVAQKVLDEVIQEIDYVIVGHLADDDARQKLLQSITLQNVYTNLMKTVGKPCNNPAHPPLAQQGRGPSDVEAAAAPPPPEDHHHQVEAHGGYEDLDIGCSLTSMGATLAQELMQVYNNNGDQAAGLWRDLANFWTGFLLHLAANTGAATHGRHLAGDSELITHLWALLTHAGYRGNAVHGEQGLDQDDTPDINQQSANS